MKIWETIPGVQGLQPHQHGWEGAKTENVASKRDGYKYPSQARLQAVMALRDVPDIRQDKVEISKDWSQGSTRLRPGTFPTNYQ